MALSSDRNTHKRAGDLFVYLLSNVKAFAGGIACVNSSGYAVPGSTTTGLKCVGRFNEQVDNSGGSAGDKSIEIEAGIFRFDNSASDDAITLADVGNVCYIVDDETVAKTSGTNTRSPAGIVEDVDSGGVWVRMGQNALVAPALSLLAASNLSDLSNAATARGNLGGGANKIILALQDIDLVGAHEAVVRLVSPVAGDIAKIYSVIDGALTVGDATLTAKIGATAVTGGVVTITQDGSDAGDIDDATPSDNKTVSVGSLLSITVGGTNTAEKTANVVIVITPSA